MKRVKSTPWHPQQLVHWRSHLKESTPSLPGMTFNSFPSKNDNRQIQNHICSQQQMSICTMWPSFPSTCCLQFIIPTKNHYKYYFMPVSSITISLGTINFIRLSKRPLKFFPGWLFLTSLDFSCSLRSLRTYERSTCKKPTILSAHFQF